MSPECSQWAHNLHQPQTPHIPFPPSVSVSISSVPVFLTLPLSPVEREQLFWQNYIKLVTVIFGSSWLIVSVAVLRPRSEEIHSLLGRVINIVRPARTGRGYFSIIVISNDNQESNTGNTDQTARQRHNHFTFTSSSFTGWQLKRFIFLGKYLVFSFHIKYQKMFIIFLMILFLLGITFNNFYSIKVINKHFEGSCELLRLNLPLMLTSCW